MTARPRGLTTRTTAARLALATAMAFAIAGCTSGTATAPDGGSSAATTTPSAVREGAPVTSAPSIDLSAVGDFGGGVTAKITKISPVQATASLPGDIEGPAIAITIEIDNASPAPIGLTGVAVSLTDSAGNPATSSRGNSAEPLAGMLVESGKATGTYVFAVAPDARNPVTFTIGYSPGSPTLVFAGDVPAG